jgi:hypothetical protein
MWPSFACPMRPSPAAFPTRCASPCDLLRELPSNSPQNLCNPPDLASTPIPRRLLSRFPYSCLLAYFTRCESPFGPGLASAQPGYNIAKILRCAQDDAFGHQELTTLQCRQVLSMTLRALIEAPAGGHSRVWVLARKLPPARLLMAGADAWDFGQGLALDRLEMLRSADSTQHDACGH